MKFSILSAISILGLLQGAQLARAEQQVLTLRTNWNLLSLWVQPTNPAVEAVLTNLIGSGRLLSVFTYEYEPNASQGTWKRFYPGLTPDKKPWLNTLTQFKPGQGYWVNLTSTSGPPVNLTVSGTAATPQTAILRPGWNLVGLRNDRRVFWADAFGSTAGGLEALFSYDASSRTFSGFNRPVFAPANLGYYSTNTTGQMEWTYTNEAGALRYIEPGQALWVKVPGETDLTPVLEVEVESDVDAFPPGASANQWFQPGFDTDMNGNGVLDYGFSRPGQYDQYGNEYLNTQDTIWFRVPVGAAQSNLVILRQDITILNKGAGGILHFEVSADVPWVSISPTTGSVLAGPGGQVVTLQADLAGLAVGEYRGALQVRGSGGTRFYYILKLTVPELDGLYSGEITMTNMQARASYPLTWPVQLLLNLRGTSWLQAAGSPHFAADIPLTNNGSTTNFDLGGVTGLDAGDPANPLSIPLQRSIRFRGARTVPPPGQTVGLNLGLMGQYEEVLQWLPDGPTMLLQGFFTLYAKTDKKALEEP